jgi:hypothetical protein
MRMAFQNVTDLLVTWHRLSGSVFQTQLSIATTLPLYCLWYNSHKSNVRLISWIITCTAIKRQSERNGGLASSSSSSTPHHIKFSFTEHSTAAVLHWLGVNTNTLRDLDQLRRRSQSFQYAYKEAEKFVMHPHKKKTPWSESAIELYRQSDRRFSAKWLPTFADKGCHVVGVTDPYGRILGFLDRSLYFSTK